MVRGLTESIDVERPPVPAVPGHLDDVRAEPPRAIPEGGVHRGVRHHPIARPYQGCVHDEIRLRRPGRNQHMLPRNAVQRRDRPAQRGHARNVPPAQVELCGQVPAELPNRERVDVRVRDIEELRTVQVVVKVEMLEGRKSHHKRNAMERIRIGPSRTS